MQTNLLPNSIPETLEKGSRRFLWIRVDRSRFMARTSWDKVTRPMNEGVLGIRRLKEWNLDFMDKLGWKILTEPGKLWVQIFNEKYLKRSAFFACIPNPGQSPMW